MKRLANKKKGFTLIELIVVCAIVGVILAIILPFFHFDPRTGGILIWIISVAAIWTGAIVYIKQDDTEQQAKTKTIVAAVLGTALVCLAGWQATKERVSSGKVVVSRWQYCISVGNGDDTRIEYAEGFDKNPEAKFHRRKGDKVQSSKLTCFLKIETGDGSKEYRVDRAIWDNVEEGDVIEYKYQWLGNYITKVY